MDRGRLAETVTERGTARSARPPAARPQRLPAARRRRQLTVVAVELFGAQGYHDTSMEDIADEAGVTKPVLYQHFPSKRDLYLELLDGAGKDLASAVAGAAQESDDPQARLLAGFRAYFRFVSGQTAAFQLLFGSGARGSDDFNEVIRRLEDELARATGELIGGPIDPAHRETLAYALSGAAEAAARRWVVTSRQIDDAPRRQLPRLDPADGDRLAERLAALVWSGLQGLSKGR